MIAEPVCARFDNCMTGLKESVFVYLTDRSNTNRRTVDDEEGDKLYQHIASLLLSSATEFDAVVSFSLRLAVQ